MESIWIGFSARKKFPIFQKKIKKFCRQTFSHLMVFLLSNFLIRYTRHIPQTHTHTQKERIQPKFYLCGKTILNDRASRQFYIYTHFQPESKDFVREKMHASIIIVVCLDGQCIYAFPSFINCENKFSNVTSHSFAIIKQTFVSDFSRRHRKRTRTSKYHPKWFDWIENAEQKTIHWKRQHCMNDVKNSTTTNFKQQKPMRRENEKATLS